MTTVLRGGSVVVGLDPAEVVPDADVLVEGERVVAVGPALDAPPDAGVIECGGCLVIPGNVNAHTHAYSALARGMPYHLAPPRDFVEILRRVWWRLDHALDEASIRASARVAGMEALLAGTTTLVDHHASPRSIDGSLDLLAEELGRLGVRAILAYEVSDRDGPRPRRPRERRLARAAAAAAVARSHACPLTLPSDLAASPARPAGDHACREDAADQLIPGPVRVCRRAGCRSRRPRGVHLGAGRWPSSGPGATSSTTRART
jgi:cytosine/adenosine deaminase-related metal-dependent hydrolase